MSTSSIAEAATSASESAETSSSSDQQTQSDAAPSATSESAAPETKASNTQSTASDTKSERPEYVPEAYWDAEKNEVKAKELGEHLSAYEQSQKSRIEDYDKFAFEAQVIGDDGKPLMKDGEPVGYDVDNDAPLVKAVRAIGKEHGLSKDAMNALASAVATQQRATEDYLNAELEKTGPDKEARDRRIQAVVAGAGRLLGDKLEDLKAGNGKANKLIAMVETYDQFEVLEALISANRTDKTASESSRTEKTTPQQLYPDEVFQRRRAS